jgi:hypothetical protein
MAFGKLGAMGRGMGHLGALGTPGTAYAIAIWGDSTAAFTGVSTYGRGWGWTFSNDISPALQFYNGGVGGNDTATTLGLMQADTSHRNWPTIIMDRPNTGETAATWVSNVKAMVALLRTDQWMVFPPAQDAPSTSIQNISDVQAALLSDAFFDGHTLDATDQAAYLAAVDDSTTRSDGLHFNDKGQAIQTHFARAFFVQAGWRPVQDEVTSLVARFTTPPSLRRKGYINSVVERLKHIGVWAKRDALYIVGEDAQSTQLNWMGSNYNLTTGGGTSFSADAYIKGNGVALYDSGFNPTTATSPKFLLNSAHMGLWSRTNLANGASASWEMGSSSSAIRRDTTSGQAGGRVNSTGFAAVISGGFPGNSLWSRTGASAWKGYAQGLAVTTATDASGSLTNANFTVCGVLSASVFGVNEICAARWGGALTDDDAYLDHITLNAHLKAIGAI